MSSWLTSKLNSTPDLNPLEPKWAPAKAIRKQKNGSIKDFLAHDVLSLFYMALAISMAGRELKKKFIPIA